MKLGLFSDPHYSSQEVTCGKRYNSKSLEKIRKALGYFREEGCGMVICLGDLIDREEEHEAEIEHLARIRKAVEEEAQNMGFVNVMGNHDAFAFTPEEFYEVLGKKMSPSTMQIGDATLIFLDACYFASGVHYAPGDDDWMDTYYPHLEELRGELMQAQGNVYILMHQNIDPNIHESHCLSNAQEIRALLEESGKVKCVVQGHYHAGAENEVNGIRYLTLPAMCEMENAVYILEI